MTHEELIKAINQLPVEDRLAIRDEISKGIDRRALESRLGPSIVERLQGIGKHETGTEKQSSESGNGQPSLSQTLYGILQFEAGPPSDDEVKDMIADYLHKKYY